MTQFSSHKDRGNSCRQYFVYKGGFTRAQHWTVLDGPCAVWTPGHNLMLNINLGI